MLKKLLLVVAMYAVTASAFSDDLKEVEKTIELKDGSTLYIFKDGKMGMENKFGGWSLSMEPGQVMEAKDGTKIIMNGNEIWRVDHLLRAANRPG
ncbi:MAG: periplasmic Cu(I)/Cu(II)-binding protein CopK [Sterolibacterium sp.]|jgi:hypothetical protein